MAAAVDPWPSPGPLPWHRLPSSLGVLVNNPVAERRRLAQPGQILLRQLGRPALKPDHLYIFEAAIEGAEAANGKKVRRWV